jgi:cell division protein FtsZ
MPIFETSDQPPYDFTAKIKVIGVGGGGGNAVNSLLEKGLYGIDFYVMNTDLQALQQLQVPNRLAIGRDLTKCRGAGGRPEVGEQAARDAHADIEEILRGADMVFISAGMGGGTGTGAAPVVAEIAKQMGILSIAVVSLPFKFEGQNKLRIAQNGINRLKDFVDTLIVVSNDRLTEVSGKGTKMSTAFEHANQFLLSSVSSVNDLITKPGLINVDFADIQAIMSERGGAVLGVGVGKGENRAAEAVTKATKSPLLDKLAIDGATGVLICVTGGEDLALSEVSDAVNLVYEAAAPEAQIIFGAVIDPSIEDEFRVTLIATGFPEQGKGLIDPHGVAAGVGAAVRPTVTRPVAQGAGAPPPAPARPTPATAPAPAPVPPSSSTSLDPFASPRPMPPVQQPQQAPRPNFGLADDNQPGAQKPRFLRPDDFDA